MKEPPGPSAGWRFRTARREEHGMRPPPNQGAARALVECPSRRPGTGSIPPGMIMIFRVALSFYRSQLASSRDRRVRPGLASDRSVHVWLSIWSLKPSVSEEELERVV